MNRNYNFTSLFTIANICSFVIFFASIMCIIFKGLNFGIDFKGGTLIELRVDNNQTKNKNSKNKKNKYKN